MNMLEDAWSWYEENRRLVRLMSRLGRNHWEGMPWGELEKEESFRDLAGPDVAKRAENVLAEIDDIAIFVLFSVFEAIVRDHVLEDVREEVATLRHPALLKTAARMKENVEEGSFYLNVLSLFKRRRPRPCRNGKPGQGLSKLGRTWPKAEQETF